MKSSVHAILGIAVISLFAGVLLWLLCALHLGPFRFDPDADGANEAVPGLWEPR